QAKYIDITLPGISLQDIDGRVCLRDIVFDSSTLSFSIDLDATIGTVTMTPGAGRQIRLSKTPTERVSLHLRASALLTFSDGKVSGELIHVAATAPAGSLSTDGITVSGLAASLEVLGLEFDGTTPKRGFVQATIEPQPPNTSITVILPAGQQFASNNVVLS